MYNLSSLNIFSEIDRQFSRFICSQDETLNDEQKKLLEELCLCLSYYANKQHSVLPLDEVNLDLINHDMPGLQTQQFSFISEDKWLQTYARCMGTDTQDLPLILDRTHNLLYLNKYYRAESAVAQFISRLSNETQMISAELCEQVNKVFPDLIEGKTNWQKVAAFMALRSRFCVISGGPGTGKTTTVGKILSLLIQQDPNIKIDLVAPTGKASDRLGESILSFINHEDTQRDFSKEILEKIPCKAQTIHRYLGFKAGGGFKLNKKNTSNSDILLIDESSMVPLLLFRSVLDALKNDCRVILLGDKDQLAAVETGNVLGDLTSGGQINAFSEQFCRELEQVSPQLIIEQKSDVGALQDLMVKLEHSFRFDSSSGIGTLAKDVNEAHVPHPLEQEDYFDAFEDIALNPLPESMQQLLGKDSIQNFFKEYRSCVKDASAINLLDKLKQFRFLCASRNGDHGSGSINQIISQEIFRSNDDELYPGRAIMITRNDYDLQVFNGDIGIIMPNAEALPKAYFLAADETLREFPPSVLPDYETAFAMTIHKSQGSEYKNVHLILSDQADRLLSKELLYTGITRAKGSVNIYSQRRSLLKACQQATKRFSGLIKRLES